MISPQLLAMIDIDSAKTPNVYISCAKVRFALHPLFVHLRPLSKQSVHKQVPLKAVVV